MFNVSDYNISLILILRDDVKFYTANKLYCEQPYLDMPVIIRFTDSYL
jgi:hypothetical protein